MSIPTRYKTGNGTADSVDAEETKMSCEHNDLYECQDCSMSRMANELTRLRAQLAERDVALIKAHIEIANLRKEGETK